MTADAPDEARLSDVLEVLGWEIELAGARCIFLDALIGELMPSVPEEKRARLMEGLHAVDLLGQHLTSLSAFAQRMSADVPSESAAPVAGALSEITLGDLADRMRTSLGGREDPSQARADAGDLDLF
jgi:hypothetical protein